MSKLLDPLRAEAAAIQSAIDRLNVGLDLLAHDLAEQPPATEPNQPPPAVTNLRVFDIKTSSMKAEWDASPGADEYRVDWTNGQWRIVQGTSVSIPYLTADNVYNVVVTPFNQHGQGPKTTQQVRTPKSDGAVPVPEQPPVTPTPTPTPNPSKLPDLSFDFPIPGVNIAGPDFRPTAYWPTEADYELAASKGVKGIRQPFRWDIVQPEMNGPVELTQILACLDWAAKRGQRVVIDMHDYMRRDGGNVKNPIIGSAQVPQAAYNDAWVKIARGVMGHPGLGGYGLMNEPNATGGTWHTVAQRVIEAIRTVDRQTLRFIAGDGWGNARNFPEMNPHFPLDDPDGLNVYEAHSYDDDKHSGVWPDRNEVVPLDRGVERLRPFVDWCRKHGVRGYIGEIGGFGTSNLGKESMLTGEPAAAATESAKRALAYLVENHIPFAWWAAGGHWGNSLNAIQIGGRGANRQYREPISIIAAHAGKVTRRMRPE